MVHPVQHGIRRTPRRGMLLLLVLSILALFVVIGAVGILLALRARESARAFAAASASNTVSAGLARAQLDAALLKLIRGPSQPLLSGTDVTESLLEDKYGTSQVGTITTLTSSTTALISGAVISITSTISATGTNAASGLGMVTDVDMSSGSYTLVGPHPSSPAAFAGRVLTFVPGVGDPTAPTSHRILRFQPTVTTTTGSFNSVNGTQVTGTFWTVSTAGNFWLANAKLPTPLPLPLSSLAISGSCEAVINGREFCPGQRLCSGTAVVGGTAGRNESFDAFGPHNPFLSQPVLRSSTVASFAQPAFGGSATATVDNDGDGVPDGVWLSNVLPPQRAPDGSQLTFDVSYLVLDLDGRINLNAHGSFVRAQVPRDTTWYPQDPASVPVGMGYGPADVDAALAVSGLAAGSGTNRWAILLQGGTVTQNALVSSTTQWRPTPRVDGASQPGRYGLGAGASPGGSSVTATSSLNADYWAWNTSLTGTVRPNSPTDLRAQLQVFTSGNPPELTFAWPQNALTISDSTNPDVLGTGTDAHPYRMRLDDDAPRAAGAAGDDAIYTVAELERILRAFDSDAATLAPRLAAMLDDHAERSRMTVTTDSWDTPAITGSAVLRTGSSVSGTAIYNVHSPEVVAGLRFNLNRPLGSGSSATRAEYFRQLYTLVVSLGVPAADAAQWTANVIEFRDPDSIMTWYPYDSNPLDGAWTADAGVWGAERPEIVIQSGTYDSSNNSVAVWLYRPWACKRTSGTANAGLTELIDPSLGNRTTNVLNLTGTVPSGTNAIWRLAFGGSAADLGTLVPAGSAGAMPTGTSIKLTGSTTSSPSQLTLLRLADPTRTLAASNDSGKNDYVPISVLTLAPSPPPATTSGSARTLSGSWLHWPNRDLVSHGELLTVPSGTMAAVSEALFADGKEAFLALTGTLPVTGSSGSAGPLILDATIVPSRFAGAGVSVANGSTWLAGTGFENFQHGQFSRWREPGRVNVNTIVTNTGNSPASLDNAVWTALIGRTGTANPATDGTYSPITLDRDLLVMGGDARFLRSGANAASAFLKRSTAIRLANCATVRSHVFAVWITLRINVQPSGGAPQYEYARLFAIVDRSIPVGYAPGRTLNVRETIRLQRFLP